MTERDKAVAEVLYKSKNAAAAAAANAAGGASVFQPPSANPTPRPLIIPPLPRESSERKEPDQPEDPRSLTVALIGAPNAGKSTLVNQITNAKVMQWHRSSFPEYRRFLQYLPRLRRRGAISSALTPTRTCNWYVPLLRLDSLCAQAFFDTPGIVPVWQQKQYVSCTSLRVTQLTHSQSCA